MIESDVSVLPTPRTANTMHATISSTDSVRALLHAFGFTPLEAKEFACSLARKRRNRIKMINDFLCEHLCKDLLIHVQDAILHLLKSKEHSYGSIWDALVSIWNKSKYNLAVVSHRLRTALAMIEREPICTIIPMQQPIWKSARVVWQRASIASAALMRLFTIWH